MNEVPLHTWDWVVWLVHGGFFVLFGGYIIYLARLRRHLSDE